MSNNTNTNTIDVVDYGSVKTTRHTGPGQHRASKKILPADDLRTATEIRRRERTAKQTKGGRYRATTNKVNLTWFIGFIVVATFAFASVFGLLTGMLFPEPIVTLQTQTKTVTREIDIPSIPSKCIDALDSADKGFEFALANPKVQLIQTGKKHEISKVVPYTVKYAKAQQAKVYKQQGKFDTTKAECLSSDTDAKQISEHTEYTTK